ncbi:MAG: calcineurin-like phosphoesterase C-terminal domain-containing protein [Asticcacaulis sp.]
MQIRNIASRLVLGLVCAAMPAGAALAQGWQVAPEVIKGRSSEVIRGIVFEDANADGRHQATEAGVAGVLVSNGLEVVRTDAKGAYAIAVRPDMDLFVVQPSGWQVPVDARNVPQFSYTHKPDGSPAAFRFGGLAATGAAPERVNFPLRRAKAGQAFTCAMIGDSQTYSNHEASQYRDSAVADMVTMGLKAETDCMLYLGDVVGDDLGLLDRVFELGATVGVPQWAVSGNHDVDFDAPSDEHSLDTWRRVWGPAYYAFEMGNVTFVALDNVVSPCNAEDAQKAGREACLRDARQGYNGRITDTQMQWVANLLKETPKDRLVVFAHHIPLVSYIGAAGGKGSQTDNATALYALAEGREALDLSGHTHTLENHDAGQHFKGWQEAAGVGPLPFRHIVAGAASGRWWQGDFNIDGDSHAITSSGEPKGVLMIDFDGADYKERFVGSRLGTRGQWVDFNTPAFRSWYTALDSWRTEDKKTRDPVPPVSVNDLEDTRLFTPEALAEGVWITVNFWHGSASAKVAGTLNEGTSFTLDRVQQGAGEARLEGAEYVDPFAIKRQATVGRYAFQSRSGIERNQGWEAGRGTALSGAPQPLAGWADRSMHLWRYRLPADLSEGVHVLKVTSVDRNGQTWTDHVVFEVRTNLPPARHRREVWK